MSENKNYKILSKEEKNRELTLEIEIGVDFIESFRNKMIKSLGKEVEIKGFRKGTAPEKMVVAHVGESKIFEESVFESINQILPVIMAEEKINAITHPQINITKLAPDNPATLKAVFILMPEVKLGDYKKIAKSIPAVEVKVEDKEIEDYLEYIRKSRAEAEALKNKTDKAGGEKTAGEKNNSAMPEIDDEFVKSLGNFQNVEDFKKQLRENMLTDKQRHTKEKRRIEIMEKIINDSKIELPEILIEDELSRMLEQFKNDIRKYKMEPEDYLKEIKKTEDDLKKEWRTDAEKRAKMNLILPRIADAEKIEADAEKVEHEAKHLVEHHGADLNQAKQYVQFILRNEEVFKLLEDLK